MSFLRKKQRKSGPDSALGKAIPDERLSGGNPMMRKKLQAKRKKEEAVGRPADDRKVLRESASLRDSGKIGMRSPETTIAGGNPMVQRKPKKTSKPEEEASGGGGAWHSRLTSSVNNNLMAKRGGGAKVDGSLTKAASFTAKTKRGLQAVLGELIDTAAATVGASGCDMTLDGVEATVTKIHKLRGKLKRRFRVGEEEIVTLKLDGTETNRFAYTTRFAAVEIVGKKMRTLELALLPRRGMSPLPLDGSAAADSAGVPVCPPAGNRAGLGPESETGRGRGSAGAYDNTCPGSAAPGPDDPLRAPSTSKLFGPQWDAMSARDRELALASLELQVCRGERASNLTVMLAADLSPVATRRAKRKQAKLERREKMAEKRMRAAEKAAEKLAEKRREVMRFKCSSAAVCEQLVAAIRDAAEQALGERDAQAFAAGVVGIAESDEEEQKEDDEEEEEEEDEVAALGAHPRGGKGGCILCTRYITCHATPAHNLTRSPSTSLNNYTPLLKETIRRPAGAEAVGGGANRTTTTTTGSALDRPSPTNKQIGGAPRIFAMRSSHHPSSRSASLTASRR